MWFSIKVLNKYQNKNKTKKTHKNKKNGSHLGGRARLPDTILEEDHPMTIPSKFGSN
jgi:hypothetical protein